MRLSTTHRAALALAAAVLFGAAEARATIARYLPLEEHLALSSLVVRARVGAHVFKDGADGRPRQETTLQILETFKGRNGAGTRVIVRQMRGPVGEGFLAIPGDPELREGDEIVVFLRTDGGGVHFLTAMAQSKWDVLRDGEHATLRREIKGTAFYVDDDPRKVIEPSVEAPVPLPVFAETVRSILAAGGGK